MNSVAIGRHVVQNFLLGIPQVKAFAMKLHSMGMGRSEAKIRPVLKKLIQTLNQSGASLSNKTVLELGPGQTPDLMVGALLLGANRAIGLDVANYFPSSFRETSSYTDLKEWLEVAADSGQLGHDVCFDSHILDQGAAIPSDNLDLQFYDGSSFPIADASVDIVWSNCVLEHVSNHADIFDEIWRVLKPGGMAIHVIHLQDHITFTSDADWLRFLQYSDELWQRMFSNRSTWCNRLRAKHWRELCETKRWENVEFEETRQPFHPGFNRDKLARPFDSMSHQELAVSWLNVTLQKPVDSFKHSPRPEREPSKASQI